MPKRCFSVPYSCVALALAFALTTFFAYSTWNDYEFSKLPWAEVDCTVESATAESCSPSDGARVHVKLRPFSFHSRPLPLSQGSVDAYKNADKLDCPFLSIESAKDSLSAYPSGKRVSCYTDGYFVRLTPGRATATYITVARLRAAFAIAAAILIGVALALALLRWQRARKALVRRRGVITRDERGAALSGLDGHTRSRRIGLELRVERPARAAFLCAGRKPMDGKEARMVVAAWKEDKGDGEGTCAICLEDFEGGGEEVVRLPCAHRYHGACVVQWFLKGSASCPYCNCDLQQEVRRVKEGEEPRDPLEDNRVGGRGGRDDAAASSDGEGSEESSGGEESGESLDGEGMIGDNGGGTEETQSSDWSSGVGFELVAMTSWIWGWWTREPEPVAEPVTPVA